MLSLFYSFAFNTFYLYSAYVSQSSNNHNKSTQKADIDRKKLLKLKLTGFNITLTTLHFEKRSNKNCFSAIFTFQITHTTLLNLVIL